MLYYIDFDLTDCLHQSWGSLTCFKIKRNFVYVWIRLVQGLCIAWLLLVGYCIGAQMTGLYQNNSACAIVNYDTQLSNYGCQRMERFLLHAEYSGAYALRTTLNSYIPIVADVKINKYHIPWHKVITIGMHAPLFVIKNTPYLMLENGSVIDRVWYTPCTYQGLKSFSYKGDIASIGHNNACFAWLDKLDLAIWDEYEIEWYDQLRILLHNKTNLECTIVCRAEDDVARACMCGQMAFKRYIAHTSIPKGVKVLVDTRYKGQVICKKIGGGAYGKNIF